MKQITFRELLNLMYYNKSPKRIKYDGKLYQKYKNYEYYDTINKRFLSTVIGAKSALYGMAMYKCFTIYDDILDDKEKEYLSNIIRPFKKYVISITKIDYYGPERIEIRYTDNNQIFKGLAESVISLPSFRKDSMYKGMELNKEYTLEEIGL